MKKSIGIFILIYYSIGSLILPLADFSTISYLPEMYAHCKATEDKDMTIVDFVTDHLINIDGIFDKHDHGDEQKPHKSSEHKINNLTVYLLAMNTVHVLPSYDLFIDKIISITQIYNYDFVGSLLRPPIA